MKIGQVYLHIMELPWVYLKNSKIVFNAITNDFYLLPDEAESMDDACYIGSGNDPWSEIVRNAEMYDERIM